jgi:preprotein translocase subunit YajC
MFSLMAFAQETAQKNPSIVEQLFPFVAIFAIFYFFIIRPQTKRHKDHQGFVNQLKRGDNVVTSGGIFGTVEGLTDKFVTLEVADGVRMRVLRTHVAGSADDNLKTANP